MASSKSKRKRSDTGASDGTKVVCPLCSSEIKRSGFTNHQRACQRKIAMREKLEEHERRVGERIEAAIQASRAAPVPVVDNGAGPSSAHAAEVPPLDNVVLETEDGPSASDPGDNPAAADEGVPLTLPNLVQGDLEGVELDDIRTIYHPSSGKPTETKHFDEYGRRDNTAPAPAPFEKEPWKPFFPSLQDFSFAEVALDSKLNEEQIERLIRIIHTCVQGRDTFNVKNYADLKSMWDRASAQLTPMQKSVISVPYKDELRDYDMHYRPLWDWATDLLQDPQLASHFVWDARQVFKFDGAEFVRFYDEPWTADDFWNIQSKLPAGAKPLCFILYADKSKLSSFGKEKGYPVIARCANLPVGIRNNSNGLGGGRLVGWLPVVEEESGKRKKTEFVNFKRVVWHKAFYELLDSIKLHSKTGCWFKCADGVKRHLWPCIIILCADLEEQSCMALTRGNGGKRPCPVCLVRPKELSDLSKTYPLRTVAQSQKVVSDARGMDTKKKKEAHLMEFGLRDIDNVFWQIENSDPHHTLSFDRMHAYNGGLFEDHLWVKFKELIKGAGEAMEVQFDERLGNMLRWSGLNHFYNALTMSFSDAGKFEDLANVLVFGVYPLVKRDKDSPLWALICCIRSYCILDIYMSFEVHTSHTIAAGRQELQRFGELIKDFIALTPGSAKSWDFPKMHWHLHSFDHVEEKGVTRNFNAKPNEKLHGPIRQMYLRQTNKKNVGEQIVRLDHLQFVSLYIRERIDEANEHEAELARLAASAQEELNVVGTKPSRSRRFLAENVTLGSQRPPCSLQDLEQKRHSDEEFRGFRQRLSTWMTSSLRNYGVLKPEDKDVTFHGSDKVQEYQLLKVTYESTVDWKAKTDNLHCSPSFHDEKRYDYVIIDTVQGPIFAQLLYVFTCEVGDVKYPLALMRPFDAPTGPVNHKDQDLGILRLRARPRKSAEFFFVRSIIRGALLAEAKPGDYCVVDVVDADMFLRVQKIRGE